MMLSVAELITCPEFAQTVDIIRNELGKYDDYGMPTDGNNIRCTAQGVVQPATEQELKQSELGELKEEVIKFITTDIIKTATETMEADRIVWRQSHYKVVKVKNNIDYGFLRVFAVYEGVCEV